MTSCDPDTSVPECVVGHPETLPVFHEWGNDYSGGGKSPAYACRERGPGAVVSLARLLRCLGVE